MFEMESNVSMNLLARNRLSKHEDEFDNVSTIEDPYQGSKAHEPTGWTRCVHYPIAPCRISFEFDRLFVEHYVG